MEWRTISVEVSEAGDVRIAGQKIASTRRSTRGYFNVEFAVHRLVAWAFHGPPPAGAPVVNHIDGNPSNNAPENLEWVSQRENMLRATRRRAPKLSSEAIAAIRAARPVVPPTLGALAKQFGVSYAAVRAIRSQSRPEWRGLSNRTILTPAQVEIARQWAPPRPTASQVGRCYGVSQATIRSIWDAP